ncbi:Hypothetical_protein [Hexamita inflata]|uniref:Hypothetical_protein n=1 Tax=Hexamita inflata TaxID=28002 RepID=A0AA86P095_9EUKA|nr:Hypothetical protein HINF_LOCUS16963 [Hexamita inflata]
MQINSSILDQRIFDNVTLLNTALAANSTYLQNLINSSAILLNTTVSALNSSINQKNIELSNNFSIINSTLSQQNDFIFSLLKTVSDLQSQLVDLENAELEPQFEINDFQLQELICNYNAFTQQFDIQSISQTVSSLDFSQSYVYGNTQIINNAFINILDNSLTNSFSLFYQQTYYYNIKVQIGSQSMQSGSIISDQSIKSMNNIIIFSKSGSLSQISSQLNILSRVSSGLSIRNINVNLLLSSQSNGNISLIGQQKGTLNIRNYQINGSYYTKQCMTLCVINSNQAQISITNVNFKPDFYVFGNQSSFLFAFVSTSTIQIKQLVIQIGSTTINNLLTSAQTSTYLNQFQYGGIISQISGSSVIIHNSALQIYLKQTTNYINSSGVIIGTSTTSIISINQICIFEQTTLTGSIVNQSGFFGIIGGKISITNVNINYSVSGNGQFSNFGTIGVLTIDCTMSSFENVYISFISIQKSSYDDSETNVAAMIGFCNAKLVYLNDSSIQGNITAASNVALISGFQNSNFTISNIVLQNSNIMSLPQSISAISAGLFGSIESLSKSNSYNGLQVQVNIQSTVSGNNSHSAAIVALASNIYLLYIQQCYIQESFTNSSSQSGISSSSGIISFGSLSQIICKNITLQNSQMYTQLSSGITAGLFAQSLKCNVTLINMNIFISHIISNSSIPIVGGIFGIINSSQFNISNYNLDQSIIKGEDIYYPNQINSLIRGNSGGIIAFASYTQIIVTSVNVQNSNISQKYKQHASAGGLNGEFQNVKSSVNNSQVVNLNIICYSQEANAHIGGISSILISSQEIQQNVTVQYVMLLSQSISGQSHVGGIIGWNGNSSIVNISSGIVFAIQVQINGLSAYCGGMVGTVYFSNFYVNGFSLQNSNLSANVTTDCVLGSAIGIQWRLSASYIILSSLNIKNVINNLIGNTAFSSAFIGTITAGHYSLDNSVDILNSEIYTIQINTQATINYINLILRPQQADISDGSIKILNTKSLGFSSINNQNINPCENVKMQQINNQYYSSVNGCI